MKQRESKFTSAKGDRGRRHGLKTKGVALVMTLILLALLSACALAITLLVSGDTMINGYYSNYRASFYAADSGVNAIVEAMKNSLNGAANPKVALYPLPVPNGLLLQPTVVTQNIGSVYPAALKTAYQQFQGASFTVGDPGSWNGTFTLLLSNPGGANILGPVQLTVEPYPLDSHTCLPSAASANPPATCGSNTNTDDYETFFAYPYTITVQGTSAAGQIEQITQSGIITYASAPGTNAGGNDPSFSKWGAFITNFSDCQGPLVPGTMTGPFFTDGQWNFGNDSNPGYTFTGTVGQTGANVSWWNGNQCTDSPTAPNGFNQPVFQKNLALSQAQVTPPTNSYNQAQAVLDGKGDPPCTALPCAVAPAPSSSQMAAELKTISGTAYSNSTNGVYIPYYTSGASVTTATACTATSPCFGGNPSGSVGGDGYAGGFYINGNASITLSATTGGDGTSNPTQTYTITQGSTTTTIIVDNAANSGFGTTTVKSGSTTLTLQGVPEQLDPTTGNVTTMQDPSGTAVNPTLIYVNGEITALSGTVQNDVGITIAAANNVSITGDLTYLQQPVSVPSDTLNSTTNAGVLGIYTTGNIDLYPNSSGSNAGNLTVDASLAALSGQTGSSANSGFDTPGNTINTWTIVGGRSEDHAHSVSINQGNTYYDQRFASGSFGPPWFPTAVPNAGNPPVALYTSMNIQRLSWQETRP
jgi:hypothetical protein